MKRVFLMLSALGTLFLLSGCIFLDDGDYCRNERCVRYGTVMNCSTYLGQTTCHSQEQCMDSVCCMDQHSCAGQGCLQACGNMAMFSANTFTSQLQYKTLDKVTLKDMTIDKVMAAAANADFHYIFTFGLQRQDLMDLSENRTLSSRTVQRMANILDESPELVKKVTSDLAQAFQSQKVDVKSSYWQTCMSSGNWRTDKNFYCKSTSWPGCSPESGANICLSETGVQRLKSMEK